MADERDPKVSQRYRELGTQEPPRHVDDAILAASRRAVRVHLAPLVPPTGRRRWYFPVAAAAIIMLSVAVAWHMQVDSQDPDGYVASAPSPEAPKEAPAEKKIEMQAAPAAKTPPAAASRMEERPRESAPVAGARAPEAARSDRMVNRQIVEPPEKWLERIAALRKEGKHEEADKALEEFRKRYPDYKIPESALKK